MVCHTQHHECPAGPSYALLVAQDGLVVFTVDMNGNTDGAIGDAVPICERLAQEASPEAKPNSLMILGLVKAIKKAKEK